MGDMKDPGDEGPVPLFRPGLPVERRSGILPGVKLAKPKIAVAIGAMLIAAVLVLPRSRPAVELRFVRYTNVGTITCAVLGLTDHGASRLLVMNTAGLDTLFCSLSEKSPTPTLDCWLPQRSGTQFVAWPRPRVDFPDPHEGDALRLVFPAASNAIGCDDPKPRRAPTSSRNRP
jgi:hypothetical protein